MSIRGDHMCCTIHTRTNSASMSGCGEIRMCLCAM
jgi:hypothetical protein